MSYFLELTEEDRKKPYTKFLDRPMGTPAKEVLEFLEKEQPTDPALALLPDNHNMNDILKPGYLSGEYACCTLPNGGGYVAMLNKMPGVTFEMYCFWKKWWLDAPDSNLRYRIWYPKSHYRAGYRWSNEDFGNGTEDLYFFAPITPAELGLDVSLISESVILMADGCMTASKAISAEKVSAPMPAIVCHFVREMPQGGGIELRSRFWKGYHAGPDGMFCAIGPDVPRETNESLYQLARHNAEEMANLASFLPELYEMEKDTVDISDMTLTAPGAGKK